MKTNINGFGLKHPMLFAKKIWRRVILGLGSSSIIAGAAFLAVSLMSATNVVKFVIGGFLLLLGAIDLVLYVIFGKRLRR